MSHTRPVCPDTSTVLLACLAATAPAAHAADRPNIIFIMADDHAAHAIGAYGSRVNQTPQHRPPGAARAC